MAQLEHFSHWEKPNYFEGKDFSQSSKIIQTIARNRIIGLMQDAQNNVIELARVRDEAEKLKIFPPEELEALFGKAA